MNRNTMMKFQNNLPYIIWCGFYWFLFSLLFGGSANAFLLIGVLYATAIALALLAGEHIFKNVMNLRLPKTSSEVSRLMPLFDSVYENAQDADEDLNKNITLYITDDMDINAFAVGRGTMVITKGAINFLSDECLQGLMAHEFGHFSNGDTVSLIMEKIGNFMFAFLTKGCVACLNFANRLVGGSMIISLIQWIIIALYKLITFVGDLILMPVSHRSEYKADYFAFYIGYGDCLASVLKTVGELSSDDSGDVLDRLRSTHPAIHERIAMLESYD